MKSDQAELTIGSAQDVTITLPNVEVRRMMRVRKYMCLILRVHRRNFREVRNRMHRRNV